MEFEGKVETGLLVTFVKGKRATGDNSSAEKDTWDRRIIEVY